MLSKCHQRHHYTYPEFHIIIQHVVVRQRKGLLQRPCVCLCCAVAHLWWSDMMNAGPAGGWLLCHLLPREKRGYRSLIPDRRLMNVSGMMVPPNEGVWKGQSVSPLPDKQEVAIIHPATQFEECLFCTPGIKTAACMYLRACFLELFHKLQSAAAVQNHLHTTVQPDRAQSNRGGFRGFKLWRWSRPPPRTLQTAFTSFKVLYHHKPPLFY